MAGFLERMKKKFNRNEYLTIRKAYFLAKKAHKDQIRDDNKRFFTHLLQVAKLLEKLDCDYETICAGLLHDTIEDTNTTIETIQKKFNKNIFFLVDAATKIDQYDDIHTNKQKTMEKIHSMAKIDKRVYLVKIVDRLHNLKTCQIFSNQRKINFAQDTLENYVPMAESVGQIEIMNEMEKLAKNILKKNIK